MSRLTAQIVEGGVDRWEGLVCAIGGEGQGETWGVEEGELDWGLWGVVAG